jgi:hypothetical protein
VGGLVHIIVMPVAGEERLLAAAVAQEAINDLDIRVVLAPGRAVYVKNGRCSLSGDVPCIDGW